MDEIKKQLSDSKEALKKNILIAQNVLGHLYQLKAKNLNNKLIFIKKGIEKVNLAQKYISSLKLSYDIEQEDKTEIKSAVKEAMFSLSKLEKLLESKQSDLRRVGTSTSINNYRNDMDALRLAFACLRTLDTDMNLEEKDFDKNEIKAMRL